MLSMLLLSLITFLWSFSDGPPTSQGGVNKATFDKIKLGMTPQEIQAIIGRGKACNIFVSQLGYSQFELWSNDNDTKRIWVEYEPTVANGRTTRASFKDFSTTPFLEFELRRVATKEECTAAIDQLITDAQTKMPLDYSAALAKKIPVDGQKATKFINDHPDYKSYHLLMALREMNPIAYLGLRQHSRFFGHQLLNSPS